MTMEKMECEAKLPITNEINEEKSQVITIYDGRIANISWKDYIRQIIASCIAFSLVIQAGVNMAYSSILLPQLGEDNIIHVTRSEASWIASVVTIALPLGSLIIGPLMDMYGRKIFCIINTIPFIIAWFFQIYATKLWHFYIARIITGFAGGLSTVAIVYVSEISHPTLRQSLLSLNSVFVSLGILLTYFFGTLIRWKMTGVFFLVVAALTSIGMFFLPESPYWEIIFRNNHNGAQKSFRWLYKNQEVYESQYHHLLSIKSKNNNTSNEKLSIYQKFKNEIKQYAQKSVYKPTIILILIFFAQQISGGYVVVFYATDIFRKLDGQSKNQGMSEFLSLVLLGIIRFVTSIISAVISKNIGRRVILIISGVGMAFFSFFAGVYIYFTLLPNEQITAMNIITSDQTYNIAFLFVLGYVAFASLGFLIIPWTLIGELIPVKVRGTLSGALISLAYGFMFLFVKIFPTILDTIDIHCIFYVLSIFNLISVMFIYFFLPETLGKNFNEIEAYFER